MSATQYPFIDLAVHDAIRPIYASGRAVVVLSPDLQTVIWANGAGATLFGHDDIEAIIGSDPGMGFLAKRQLAALPGFPSIGEDRTVMLRLGQGFTSPALPFEASEMQLSEGSGAIVLSPADGRKPRSAKALARSLVAGIVQAGHHAACLDGDGAILAATPGYEETGISGKIRRALIREVAGEQDRLVKRTVDTSNGSMPAGIARLSEDPAYYLLMVVADAADTDWEEDRSFSAVSTTGEYADGNEEVEPVEQETTATVPATASESPVSTAVAESEEPDAVAPAENEEDPQPFGKRPAAAGLPSATEGNREPEAHKQPAGGGNDDQKAAPIRFVWKTDDKGKIREVSQEFLDAVGMSGKDIHKRTFGEISAELDLDPNGEILRLMERRDTWSGRQVWWPVAGSNRRVPVDLAALPIYDRGRNFQGFRGFGVARIGEAIVTAERKPQAEDGGAGTSVKPSPSQSSDAGREPENKLPEGSEADLADPFKGEVPAMEIAPTQRRRSSDKVIDLASHMGGEPDAITEEPQSGSSGLSEGERSAFREIAERLRKEALEDAPSPLAFGKRRPLADKKTGKKGKADEVPAAAITPDEEGAGEPASTGEISAEKPAIDAAHDKRSEEREKRAEPTVLRNAVPSAFAGLSAIISERQASRSMLATLPIPILVYSPDGPLYANPTFFDFTGHSGLEALREAGGIDAIFVNTTDADGGLPAENFDGELRIATSSGDPVGVDAHLQSVPWDGEKALLLSFIHQQDAVPDVAPVLPVLEEAEEEGDETAALQRRIDELVSILDTATDGVVTLGRDGEISSINRSAQALFGYESDEITGQPFGNLFAVESQTTARDYLTGLSEHGVASLLNDGREVIGREAQGRFIPLFMTIGKLAGDSGYCAVLRDITQWKRAEDELTEAKRVAEQTSSQKTEFLARISHEIRTPLNAIIGFSELMLDEKFGPIGNERYRDYLGDINKSGSHVLDLVNDLLDISKIEAGQLELDYEAVPLNDALNEAIAMIRPQANRERVIIRSSLSSGLPDVVADLRSIRQIALNLLSNAIRYTLAGGQVIVSTTYEPDGSVVLRVRDTGVGMSQVEINQALKPFRQVNALKRTHDKGSGLGLPLTKAMVEANRAKFLINSAPGEGTVVEVTFPPARVLAD